MNEIKEHQMLNALPKGQYIQIKVNVVDSNGEPKSSNNISILTYSYDNVILDSNNLNTNDIKEVSNICFSGCKEYLKNKDKLGHKKWLEYEGLTLEEAVEKEKEIYCFVNAEVKDNHLNYIKERIIEEKEKRSNIKDSNSYHAGFVDGYIEALQDILKS